jgi:hypothetical protein
MLVPKIDWNGYLPSIVVARLAKKLSETRPEQFRAILAGGAVDGHAYVIDKGTFIYHGQVETLLVEPFLIGN